MAIAAPTARRRVRGKRFLVTLIVIAVLLGAAAASYFTGFHTTVLNLVTPSQTRDLSLPNFVDLDEMVIVLPSDAGRQKFLKIAITLEVSNSDDLPLVRELTPLIVDSYQFFLRELQIEELRGSAGLYAVKEELLARTNLIIAPAEVQAVLFRDLLIQ